MVKRIFLIVLDSLGIGNAADAKAYGDEGSNTLKTIFDYGFPHENLKRLGLFHIDGVSLLPKDGEPLACYAALKERSAGKDTTTGHWELMGVVTDKPFDTFPNGFPRDFIRSFERETGKKTICNLPYSGTQVIEDYAKEQARTGALIVYTSADSVFQIAAREDIISREQLYSYCKTARRLLDESPYRVGRVIARPFIQTESGYVRTDGRHDFSLMPPENLLDELKEKGFDVIGVGKISDIFAGRGLTESLGVNKNNADGLQKTKELLKRPFHGLCFVNLVDGDSVYGHRRDVSGYAACIGEFDSWLGGFMEEMREGDVLAITADHGCDPAYSGTDHTRENVPFLWWEKGKTGKNYGTQQFSFVAEWIRKSLEDGK